VAEAWLLDRLPADLDDVHEREAVERARWRAIVEEAS
jgi:hypothetical protein